MVRCSARMTSSDRLARLRRLFSWCKVCNNMAPTVSFWKASVTAFQKLFTKNHASHVYTKLNLNSSTYQGDESGIAQKRKDNEVDVRIAVKAGGVAQ